MPKLSNNRRLPRRRKVVTTVNLEPEVRAYLLLMQQEFERDRSYLVNALVKDFKRRRDATSAAAMQEMFPQLMTA